VTSESKAETEPWVKEKGAKYAYAYDKGGKFQNAMGVNGIPHALLVNSQGAIVWEGHPGSLNEEEIRKALTGALKRPLWDLPKTFAPVKTAFLKGDFATAIKAASAMPGDDAKQLAETIKSVVAGTLASADKKKSDGDFLGAQKDYQRLAKGVKGLPEEQAVAEGIAFLTKDADAVKGIKLQKELEKILELPAKSKGDKAKRREALETFATKNPGTFAAAVAKKAVVDMTKQ